MKKVKKWGIVFLFILVLLLTELKAEEKILIGSSSALTGHAQFLGTEYLKGARLYIDEINSQGGISGKKIELIALDDGYEPARCAENTLKLIKEYSVLALFNYVGTPTTLYVLPIITTNKTPLLGVFSGALSLREPFNRYVINIRASYSQEINEFIKHCVEELGFKKFAVFYQYDAYGMDGLRATENALSKYNLKIIAEASYKRGTEHVEEAVSVIKDSQAEVVIMVGTYKPTSNFIKSCRKNNYFPLFYSVSFVGIEALEKELGREADNIVVSAVVPSLDSIELTGVLEFKNLWMKSFGDALPTLGAFEGFINAKVLVEALKRCKDFTKEEFINALESIKDFDLGIGANITFGASDHQGLDKVYFNIFKESKLDTLKEWQALKKFK